MDEKQIKNIWHFATKHPFQFVSTIIILFGIFWATNSFLYSETISSKNVVIESKDATIDSKDTTIETKDLRIEELNGIIKDKDDTIDELRNEILKNNLKNNALNISIQNINAQSVNKFWNWSCIEKNIVIEQLADKVSEQESSLKLSQTKINELNNTINDLSTQIPAYETGFVGKDIKVSKGSSYQADGGQFTLGVREVYSNSMTANYYTIFVLNGLEYKKNLGQSITFKYFDGYNYTINVRGTGNPALFYVYKNE